MTTSSSRTFRRGDRVRVARPAVYRSGLERMESNVPVGAVGTVTRGPDLDGDYTVAVDTVPAAEEHATGRERALAPECLELATPPAPALGTATVRVEVRFFVGDVDVTDKIGSLFV